MTKEELAKQLDGIEYRKDIDDALLGKALDDGLVIVMGASDDLCEFYGAMSEEIGCWEGTNIYLHGEHGIIAKPDCDCDWATAWYMKHKKIATKLVVKWNTDHSLPSWTYEMAIPHATFNVMEDGEVYCRGIVFEIKELTC